MLLKKNLAQYTRYQAFGFHIAISLIIFSLLLVGIIQFWYPGLLFEAGNGWKAVGIIAGIDLILGPLLTLIVFNPKKKSLRYDLIIIAFLQCTALIYGSWTIYQNRPIALVYIGSSFHLLHASAPFANDIKDLAEANQHLLYYSPELEITTVRLLPERFHAFSQFQQQILEETTKNQDETFLLIPLTKSGNRYGVKIDVNTGNILTIEPINSNN
ncbi:MAG: hypothetical protein JKY50_08845 [Oleispira sp.]|nr:hypothetical protein [Oleispira sp.]MBL4880974.1 hypothetical protein [Oleispira sp.]